MSKLKNIISILFCITMLFMMSTTVFAEHNDGSAKSNPWEDTADFAKSYDTESIDTFVPYKLTKGEVGGYAASAYADASSRYYGQVHGMSAATQQLSMGDGIFQELSTAQAYNPDLFFQRFPNIDSMIFNNNKSKFEWYPAGSKHDSAVVAVDSKGQEYFVCAFSYATALPAEITDSVKLNLNDPKNKPLLVDVLLTDGTILHFLAGDYAGKDHTNGGTSNGQDGVHYTYAPLKYPQYRFFYHAEHGHFMEMWTSKYKDFKDAFNIGTGSDKVQVSVVRSYEWDWSQGPPTRTYGKEPFHKVGKIEAYDAKDFVVKQEVLSPTSNIDITNGSTFTTTDEEEEERERLNVEILSSTVEGVSTNKKTYSLYNRFGPKIRFIEYFGEATSEVKLFDHVVSMAAQNSLDSITITDAVNYDSGIYLSSKVYDNRPPVSSIEMLSSGMQDERAKLYNSDTSGKRFAVTKGNLFLNISNSIVSFVNLLLGKEIYTAVKDKLYELTDTSVWENIVHPIIDIVYILGIIGVVISIALYAYKYLRNGNATIGQLMARCAVSFVAIVIIFGLKSNPKFLIDTSYKIVTITDDLFDESINDVFEGDEVIASDDGNNIREAAIWKTAVFEPWCKGTFGKKYENLYTQYSDKTAAEKLEQSYEEDEKNPKNVDSNGIFYNSAALTGDVVVDRGNGQQVRNWAALAYSTQSKYHIDETMYINSLSSAEGDIVFPNALKTANNNIYADTFRWIDAKMDISPQYSLEGDTVSEVPNYSGSRQFDTHYIKHGREALLKSALLLFMLPVIIFKLWAFVKLLLLFVTGLVRSFQELFKEGEGLNNFWREAKDNVVNYFYRSAQLYILIMLYIKFINKDNVLFIFAYIVLSIILTITSPRDIIYAVRKAKNFKSRYI